MSKLLKIFCIFCAIGSNDTSKILAVFPVPSISHQVVFRPLMQELAKRGHEVVVITADPAYSKGQSFPNLIEIDVHDLSYKKVSDFIDSGKAHDKHTARQINNFLHMMLEIFEEQVKSENVQKLINDKSRTFDLLFVEACVRPALSFAYLYNVPVIEFSSLGGVWGTFEITGAPTNSLVYPLPLSHRIYNLTLLEKISELYNDYALDTVVKEQEEIANKKLRSIFDSNIPDLNELRKNVQMTFLNVHPIWDFNRPVPPNVIYLGGMHHKTAKELPTIFLLLFSEMMTLLLYEN